MTAGENLLPVVEKVLIAIDALIHAKIDVYYVWNLLVLYTSDKI